MRTDDASDIIFHIRPMWGLKWDLKMGVKDKLFNWNTLYINFNTFGSHLLLVGAKMRPQNGGKDKVFDWNTLYTNFNTFRKAEFESDIFFSQPPHE